MTITTVMTELDAVNVILGGIGESPVNSLTQGGSADLADAKNTLNRVCRMMQTPGWYFNYLRNYPLPRSSADQTIPLPLDTLSFRPGYLSTNRNLTVRGQVVYDLDRNTKTFTSDITGDIVVCLPFEDTPQSFRDYVALRAARLFQQNKLGAQELSGYGAEDEKMARTLFIRDDARNKRRNVLTGSATTRRSLQRGPYYESY